MQRAELELTFITPSGTQVQAEYCARLQVVMRNVMTIREAVVSYGECTCRFVGTSVGSPKAFIEVLGSYDGVLERLTDIEYHVER